MTIENKEAIIRRLEAMYNETEETDEREALFYGAEALKQVWLNKEGII